MWRFAVTVQPYQDRRSVVEQKRHLTARSYAHPSMLPTCSGAQSMLLLFFFTCFVHSPDPNQSQRLAFSASVLDMLSQRLGRLRCVSFFFFYLCAFDSVLARGR